MFNQLSTQPESKNWYTTWKAPRQMPMRSAAPTQRADATVRAEANSTRTESQKAEDWASDCLFNCYND